jgi:hypothetical protein
MLWLAFTWVLLFLLIAGIGAVVDALVRRLERESQGSMSAIELFWLGLCVAVAFAQLYSLVLPVNRVPRVFLILLGIAGLPWLGARIWAGSRGMLGSVLFWRVLGAVVITLLILPATLEPVVHSDTLSVHFQQIKWIETYGTPIGLANLYSRYGFDSSAYILGALLDDWAWQGRDAHVVFPFIIWVSLVTSLIVVTARNRPEWRAAKIYCLFTAPYFFRLVIAGMLNHFSGEIMGSCCAVVAIVFLLRSSPSRATTLAMPSERRSGLLLALAISSLAVTAKLSSGAMLAVLVALTLVVAFRELDRAHRVRFLVVVAALPALLVGGMVMRRFLLTGWPLFPVPIGGLPVSWAVSKARAAEEMRIIADYARWPERYAEVGSHDFSFWFTPWFADFHNSQEFVCLLFTLGILAIVSTSEAVRSRLASTKESRAAIACGLLSLAFNFLSAPAMRFMSVFFWISFAAVVAYVAAGLIADSGAARLAVGVFAFFFAWHTYSFGFTWSFGTNNWTDTAVFSAATAAATTPFTVPNGEKPPLIVNVPTGRPWCINSALPCVLNAPGPKDLPRQRVPGNLGKGFLPPLDAK